MNNIKLCQTPLFTAIDYGIVREVLTELPRVMALVIELRFWKHRTSCEIAIELGVSAKNVDRWLSQAMKVIRDRCLRHPEFSRSCHRMIEAIRKSA